MSLVYEHWSLCRYARDAVFIASFALCGVSLLTLTAISVDRLLALLLGIRYRQIVTLKRTCIVTATFWILSVAAGSFYISYYRIVIWCTIILIPSCSVISIASYTKIFRTLRHHQAQVQDHVQKQPSQPNALNMAKYRKAVSSALWVQLALVVCYAPSLTLSTLVIICRTYSLHLLVTKITTLSLRVHCLNKTSTISARGKDMLVIGRDMINVFLYWLIGVQVISCYGNRGN